MDPEEQEKDEGKNSHHCDHHHHWTRVMFKFRKEKYEFEVLNWVKLDCTRVFFVCLFVFGGVVFYTLK